MTFTITPDGVENSEDTEARFGRGGHVKVRGNFKNTGKVNIDVQAKLEVLGDIINAGDFNILDFTSRATYPLFENAINDLEGEAKTYTQETYSAIQENDPEKAASKLSQLLSYLKEHPEIITSSVQILLQIFSK